MNRHFTLESAQALVPEVERCLKIAAEMKLIFESAEKDLRLLTAKIQTAGGVSVNIEHLAELKVRRDYSISELKKAVQTIQELGVQVKDLDVGLVDFPTYYRGEEVLLCWKVGESGIGWWHGLEDGFRGRKRIDRDFLDHHSGDPMQ